VGVMPYPLEKGEFPLLIEGWFNQGLDEADCGDKAADILEDRPGPQRRLKAIWRYCQIVTALRAGRADFTAISDVTKDNSLVHSSLFATGDPELEMFQKLVAEKWFGMVPKGVKSWTRPSPGSWKAGTSLGHWSGYYGNVELIMVEAMQRMLEISLGLPHMESVPQDTPDKIQDGLRGAATRVWPIYLFLTCPQPWFGAWVTWQCHDDACPVRGQVTGLLQSPGHGRPIVPSPVDRECDDKEIVVGATTRLNPYYLHGIETDSNGFANSGYAGPYIDEQGTLQHVPLSAGADQGMWLITHENHDSTIVWSSFMEAVTAAWSHGSLPKEAWELPPIAHYRCATLEQRADGDTPQKPDPAVLDGWYDTVVVAPASLDGGIP